MLFGWFGDTLPRIKVEGPRVYLRPPRRSDQKEWLALRRVSRTFLQPFEPAWAADALTPIAYRRRLRRVQDEWQTEIGYGFLIFAVDDDRMLGGITISNVRRGVVQGASIGYWIGEPHRRQGFMFEAVQLALDYCFRNLDLHRVEAACLLDNDASRNLLEKSGFKLEGIAREYLHIDSKWQDHRIFGLLRTDTRPILGGIKSGVAGLARKKG